MSVQLKLKPPECLPAEGVTAVEFKVWKNRLVAFLELDLDNSMFLPGGRYSDWEALNEIVDGKRIGELALEGDKKDDAFPEIDRKYAGNAEEKANALAKLLLQRNSQLLRFLQHIAYYTYYSKQDDIVNSSTSMSWIWRYLEKHYNIETKGSKFLDIAAIAHKPENNPNTFYKEVRARVFDNLRRRMTC